MEYSVEFDKKTALFRNRSGAICLVNVPVPEFFYAKHPRT
jgi:hypothetical protein